MALLASQIKLARKERKMTAQELADRVGISRGLVQRIEKGDPGCQIGAVFEAATIERMATHWQALLQALVSQPHSALWQLPMLDDASRRTVLEDWNATARGYPLERGVHQLFEDQVRRAPAAPALVCGDTAHS